MNGNDQEKLEATKMFRRFLSQGMPFLRLDYA